MAQSRKKKEELPAVESSDESEDDNSLLIEQVCRRLECTKRNVKRLVEDGKLTVTTVNAIEYFNEDEVEELRDSGFVGNKRDIAFDQTIKALKDAHEFINRFTSTVIDPVQNTHKALLQANEQMAAQLTELRKEAADAWHLVADLQRQKLEQEMEMERQKLSMRQRQEAFELLKSDLLPMIAQNIGSGKVLESVDDTALEALLATEGILNETTRIELGRYLRKRQEKKKVTVPQSVTTDPQTTVEKELKNGKKARSN